MLTSLPKLEHGTLAERSSDALLALIRDQKLAPGAVLPAEARLAEGLGVSRPVIREALRMLAGLGVISIMNGKGAVVRASDPSTLKTFLTGVIQAAEHPTRDVMEVRRGVEWEAAVLAADRRKDSHLTEMRRLLKEMANNLHDMRRYARFDTDLHLLIAQASGNAVLIQIVHSIRQALEQAAIFGMAARRDLAAVEAVQRLHEEIVDAIEDRDADRAGRAMLVHMESAMTILQAACNARQAALANATASPGPS
jgi:GntR family transcriptional repressor for pyruvate dehydrogenase complex